MNSGLSNMLGRPELAPQFGGVVIASDGTATPAAMVGGAMFQGGVSNTFSGDVAVGQLSAGLLLMITIGLLLTYAWTRGIQR
jgi:hypothetical protein